MLRLILHVDMLSNVLYILKVNKTLFLLKHNHKNKTEPYFFKPINKHIFGLKCYIKHGTFQLVTCAHT